MKTTELGKRTAKRMKLEIDGLDPDFFIAKLKTFRYNQQTPIISEIQQEDLNNSTSSVIHVSKLGWDCWDKAPNMNFM